MTGTRLDTEGASPRTWEECGLEAKSITLRFCKITASTGAVAFATISSRLGPPHLEIPTHHLEMNHFPGEDEDFNNAYSLRLRGVARNNAPYKNMNPKEFFEAFGSTHNVYFGGTYNGSGSTRDSQGDSVHYFVSTSYGESEDFIRNVEASNKWKIEPATLDELEDKSALWEAAKVPEEHGADFSHNIFVVRITKGDTTFFGLIHENDNQVLIPLTAQNDRFGRIKMIQQNRRMLGLGSPSYKGVDFRIDEQALLKALDLKPSTHYAYVSPLVRASGYWVGKGEETGLKLDAHQFKALSPIPAARIIKDDLGITVEPLTPEEVAALK